MALPSADNPANYGRQYVRGLKKRYHMACHNKLAHQHSLTAIEHANDISRKTYQELLIERRNNPCSEEEQKGKSNDL